MQARLLVIADEESADSITRVLDPACWDVERVELGSGALVAAMHFEPATVILDARESSQSHAEFCRTFRTIGSMAAVPLIALAKAGRTAERLSMLEAGADDCWTEAPDSREFELRLRAIHRRLRPAAAGRVLRHGGIELDLDRYTVRSNGGPVQLTAMQLKLLQHFMERPGVIFSRRELLEQVWQNPKLDEGAVTACIVRIRRALAAAGGPDAIRNVRTTGGYVFETEAETVT